MRLGIFISSIGLAACATSGATKATQQGRTGAWSGNFRPTNSAANAMLAPATPNRGAGTISITPLGGAPAQIRIEVSISGAPPNATLGWAVFGGTCGSPAPIIANSSLFATIPVSSSGDGHVRADITVTLDPSTNYHANVYSTDRPNDMNDVIMCANLSPQ
jgi:hypothetical protein